MSDTPNNDFSGATRPSSEGHPDLEAQIAQLRADIAGISESVRTIAADRSNGVRDQAYAIGDDVRERGERYMRQAQDAASDLEDQVSDKIRSEPIKSMFIAAAVGYLYARLFR